MVRLFKGTCEAVRAMHDYRGPVGPQPSPPTDQPLTGSEHEESGQHSDDDERFPQPEGDGDDGYSYGSASMPLVSRHRADEDTDVVFEDTSQIEQENADPTKFEHVPYAHRDLKPG
jgi:serine/threonine kinase 16